MQNDIIFWVGMGAAFFTTLAFLPQVIKAHVTKHTADLSLIMYVMFAAGLVLWLVYGYYLDELPILIANTATLALTLYLICLKLKHG